MFNIYTARAFLRAADVFFDADEDDPEEMAQTLNMNDTWAWACADAEYVPDAELPRVAELFWWYGYAGLLFWVSERRGQCKSEFADVNRFIEFVRHEEAIKADEPDSSKRAYLKRSYTIGMECAE